jgi:hypothetical protein
MIKFCRLGFHVGNFFQRYQSWVQFQNLSGLHVPAATVSGMDDNAIKIYTRQERELINSDPLPVVGIDLREGLKEAESGSLNDLPTNKHYIIFSGSYPNRIANIPFNHTLICYESILGDMLDLHGNTKNAFFYTDRSYNFDYPKPMQFVTFNAVSRQHRQQFAAWLPELSYQNFIFRLNQQDLGQPANHLDVIDFAHTGPDLAQWFDSSAKHIPNPHLHILGRIPNRMLDQAYFNLVLESDFNFDTHYTTEKVIRPLMLGMPFVLASTPGHLSRLRDMGFKTYSSLWDESYDLEILNTQRLRQVFDLVQSLGQFDWHKHRAELEQIGLHNRARFMNLGPLFDQEFKIFETAMQQLERTHSQFNQDAVQV